MNRAVRKNCQWCGDRPGGCLYCITEVHDAAEADDLMRDMIASGDLHMIAVRTTQEFMVRHVDGIIDRSAGGPPASPEIETRGRAARAPMPCLDHVWIHDAGNLHRRHCAHAGCSAAQVWRWLPKATDKNGEWVDEAMAGQATPNRKERKGRKS